MSKRLVTHVLNPTFCHYCIFFYNPRNINHHIKYNCEKFQERPAFKVRVNNLGLCMKELPEDFDKNFDKIKLEDIQVGDFIIYKAKERSFKGKDYPERWCQGYVSMRQNEVGKETFDTDGGEVIGFKNRGILWTVNSNNVLEWHKSNKTKEIREKATKRKKETEPEREKKRVEKRKVEAEVMEKDKEAAKDIEKNPDIIQAIRDEIEKEIQENKQTVDKEPPAKKARTPRQPRKSTTKPATK